MLPQVKCLIVDDLEENLFALATLLRSDSVDVQQAHSGAEALELLLAHDFALALVDVQMPEMDGFELAELMRGSERTRHVPIIFVTAGLRDRHRMFQGYNAGAVDFLYKPIEPYLLKSKAQVFFELYRQKQRLALDLQERTETLRLNELFTAVLGHDLRSPLNAIMTGAQVLKMSSHDESVAQVAERVSASGRRMQRMIEAMLDLSRARLGGGIVLERRRTDLRELVQRIVDEQQTAFGGRKVDVRCEGDVSGEWDADRLAQVASNLIGNALQHGAHDECVQVQLRGTQDDAVAMRVINRGVIPPDVLPHIFDPFRANDTHHGSRGLGLGLYIVQQIVRAHGGDVHVESGQDEQTVFRVEIPRLAAATAAQ